MPKHRGWHVWSTVAEGELPNPRRVDGDFWRAIYRRPRRYSGDRNWLEILDDDENVLMVLVRYGPVREAA